MSETTLTVRAVVKVPRVPNFLLIEGLSGDNGKLDVADVSNADLSALAEAWRAELFANAALRRAARPRSTPEEPTT